MKYEINLARLALGLASFGQSVAGLAPLSAARAIAVYHGMRAVTRWRAGQLRTAFVPALDTVIAPARELGQRVEWSVHPPTMQRGPREDELRTLKRGFEFEQLERSPASGWFGNAAVGQSQCPACKDSRFVEGHEMVCRCGRREPLAEAWVNIPFIPPRHGGLYPYHERLEALPVAGLVAELRRGLLRSDTPTRRSGLERVIPTWGYTQLDSGFRVEDYPIDPDHLTELHQTGQLRLSWAESPVDGVVTGVDAADGQVRVTVKTRDGLRGIVIDDDVALIVGEGDSVRRGLPFAEIGVPGAPVDANDPRVIAALVAGSLRRHLELPKNGKIFDRRRAEWLAVTREEPVWAHMALTGVSPAPGQEIRVCTSGQWPTVLDAPAAVLGDGGTITPNPGVLQTDHVDFLAEEFRAFSMKVMDFRRRARALQWKSGRRAEGNVKSRERGTIREGRREKPQAGIVSLASAFEVLT